MFDIIRTIGAVTRTIQIDSNNHFKELGLNNNLFIYIIRVCENLECFWASWQIMSKLTVQLPLER